MRLLSAHVENFGKLHDLDLDFSEGMNSFVQDNGWGKSTLAVFLCSMFYGLEDSKRDIIANERKRYNPWQGGAFGGQICFAIGERSYIVTRYFGKKASEDTFSLRDGETHLVSEDYSKNIGAELFGLGRDAFLQTIYVKQGSCEVKATDEMHAGISSLEEEPADFGRYEVASRLITDKLNGLNPDRKTGLIYKKRVERDALRSQLAESAKCQEEKALLLQEMQELDRKLSKLDSQEGDRNGRQQQIQYLERISGIHSPSGAQFASEENPVGLAEEMAGLWADYQGVEASMPLRRKNLQTMQRGSSDAKRRKGISPLILVALLFILFGVILAVTSGTMGEAAAETRLPGIFLLIAGVVIAILLLLSKLRRSENGDLTAGGDGNPVGGRSGYRDSVPEDMDPFVYESKLFKEDEEWMLEVENTIGKYLTEHGYAYFPENNGYSLQQIIKRAQAYEELQKLYKEDQLPYGELRKQTEQQVDENRKEDWENFSDGEEKTQLLASRDQKIARIREMELLLEKRECLKTSLDGLLAELKDLEATYELLTKTKEHLDKARENIMMNLSGPLMEAFLAYYETAEVSGTYKSSDFCMDAEGNLLLQEKGDLRRIGQLSQGYQDLIGLCLRMAYVDCIFQKEAPFLILDDPLVNLDQTKLKEYEHLMKTIAKKKQIIYFTCRGDVL